MRHRHQHPLYGRDHTHTDGAGARRREPVMLESIEGCPSCGEPLPEHWPETATTCPFCRNRARRRAARSDSPETLTAA